jgi:4-hydroxybenzoate polyprenyltransferase
LLAGIPFIPKSTISYFTLKLADALILSLSLALIIIGVHQSLTVGIESSYAIFMFAVALLFWFQYRRIKKPQNPPAENKKAKAAKKR